MKNLKKTFDVGFYVLLVFLIFFASWKSVPPKPRPIVASPLHRAIRKQDLDEVNRLLDSGASATEHIRSHHDRIEYTYPINVATLNAVLPGVNKDQTRRVRAKQIIEALIKHGADLNKSEPVMNRYLVPIYFDGTPLSLAVQQSDIDLFEYLVSKGADPKQILSNGTTLLFSVVGSPDRNPRMFDVLLKAGIDIEAKDKFGRTAIYYAIRIESPDTLKLFLDHHAKVNVKDDMGLSPLDFAENKECKDLLIAAGAKHGDQF